MSCQDRDNRAGHLVLNRENVLNQAVIALGPAVSPSSGVDQLRRDTNFVAGASDTAFQHIAHSEFASDLPHVYCSALVLEAGVAGDDKQLRETGQLGNDVLNDAVDKIFLLWVSAQIGE